MLYWCENYRCRNCGRVINNKDIIRKEKPIGYYNDCQVKMPVYICPHCNSMDLADANTSMSSAKAIEMLNSIDFITDEEREAKYMAIRALRKDIPVKPNKVSDDEFTCPTCMRSVKKNSKHCRKCFQRLDWSSNDE